MKNSPNTYGTRHKENLTRLARIEGQIRGLRRMIDDGAYCIDILTQLQAARSAMQALAMRILRKHMEVCVCGAARKGNSREIAAKIDELVRIISMTGSR